MRSIPLLVIAAAACRSAPAPIENHTAATPVPSGYQPLRGPERCDADCGATRLRTVNARGILRIGVVDRGLTSTLAIETAAGWFLEPAPPRGPRMGHHSPHSRGYDLDATRVDGGELVVRLVDSLRVFYPGQGAVGTSNTTWFERRCVVIDARVHCSSPAAIAAERCRTDRVAGPPEPGPLGGPRTKRTCTGGPPG